MCLRKLVHLIACMILLGSAQEIVRAQNETPFTIRYPPDGSIVREKVHIKVPMASIPEGGYISVDIDGHFVVALAPSASQRASAQPGSTFEYIWDTKSPMKLGRNQTIYPADGVHTISISLFSPRPSDQGNGDMLSGSSSIQVTLKNKVEMDSDVTLRYKFIDGETHYYKRTGTTLVTDDKNQNQTDKSDYMQRSMLLTSVDDKYSNGHAIFRNKLTKLSVTVGGQETIYPDDQLPKSLYQELDPNGLVLYQNRTTSFDAFAMLGIPISATLDLPILPQTPVHIGDAWDTANVPLDIPGTAPDKQPKVTVQSKLVDFEWQDGYPSAKIHQHYEGTPGKTITYGVQEIESPKITFDRDIWVAIRAGILLKVYRQMDITGNLVQDINPIGGGVMGMGGGSSMYGPGSSPYGGSGGYPGASGAPGGYPGMSGSSYGGYPGAAGGYPGSSGGGYPGMSGSSYGGYRGYSGAGAYGGSGGYPGGGYPGGPNAGGMYGQVKPQTSSVTIKSTMTTEIDTPAAQTE